MPGALFGMLALTLAATPATPGASVASPNGARAPLSFAVEVPLAPRPSPSTARGLRFRDRGFLLEGRRTGVWDRYGRTRIEQVEIAREDGRVFAAAVDRSALVQVASGADVDAIFRRYRLQGEQISRGARLWRVESDLDADGLALAARLIDASELTIAAPNFYVSRRLSAVDVPPNDPRYAGQWFYRTIEIEKAWAISTGVPEVTVVVIDNGCDLTHPDLVRKLDPGLDVIDRDSDPSFVARVNGNEHGTACAGIIAADTNNALGIAGACPECRLRCVRLLDGPGGLIPLDADVRAFEFAVESGASVISNSWGFSRAIPVPAALEAAIENAVTRGRGGLGAVVVFAAGNENRTIGDDELAAVPGVITVGATTIYDEATAFSNRGRAVDLVAPTGTLTTDISGADGQDPEDYTRSFGGTSSACPIVAGLAGLLVSAKPSATGAEISSALIETTRPAPYATPDANGHDLLYGHGIVAPAPALRRLLGLTEPTADAGIDDDDAGVGADAGPSSPDEAPGCTHVRAPSREASRSPSPFAAFVAALYAMRRAVPRNVRKPPNDRLGAK